MTEILANLHLCNVCKKTNRCQAFLIYRERNQLVRRCAGFEDLSLQEYKRRKEMKSCMAFAQ